MINKINKNFIWKVAIIICIGTISILIVRFNYGFYSSPIGTITKVSNTYMETKAGYDGKYEYLEKYYHQIITAKIRNGQNKGKTVVLENQYADSGVYDMKYSKGDDIFIDNIKTGKGTLTGSVGGVKRDYFFVLVMVILFGLFIIIGGKEGLLTILSLGLNLLAFYFVLLLYLKGTNILIVVIPMTIFFSAMLLFFMYGYNERTSLSFLSTIAAVAVTTIIAGFVMKFSTIDYDFLDYLNQPYDPTDAGYIFLSEILVGSLGAVMDVVVTIVMTVHQLVSLNPAIDRKSLYKSCRKVGDDIVGTMINIMLFTNIASGIPFFILSMRNGVAFQTILRYNVFFEVARFLTGSIGLVLAIPAATFISITFYTRKKVKTC